MQILRFVNSHLYLSRSEVFTKLKDSLLNLGTIFSVSNIFDKIISDSGLSDEVKETYSHYAEILTPEATTEDK
jgi:hypothetical protein